MLNKLIQRVDIFKKHLSLNGFGNMTYSVGNTVILSTENDMVPEGRFMDICRSKYSRGDFADTFKRFIRKSSFLIKISKPPNQSGKK